MAKKIVSDDLRAYLRRARALLPQKGVCARRARATMPSSADEADASDEDEAVIFDGGGFRARRRDERTVAGEEICLLYTSPSPRDS